LRGSGLRRVTAHHCLHSLTHTPHVSHSVTDVTHTTGAQPVGQV
jgi:hypothetical protein